MPTRNIPLINGHFYHIYNRVVEGRKLFYSHENYIFYLKRWKEADFSTCCRLIAYCLMPNHYHYLVQITDAALFPKKVSYFFNRYLKSLNASRKETGHYFQNRYQAKWIDDERYLIRVCCYIHRNPVKANLVSTLNQWQFSNYLEFIGKRQGELWDRNFFNTYFQSPSDYERYIQSIYSEEGLEPYLFDEE
ncbi:transposase [Candidatus Poribacteria bacterium]|nr:transposase [Candidatus Poribacteria bacterium]